VSGRRGETDAEPAELILEIVLKRRCRCGSPRAREASRQDCGERVSRKKAAALMRKHGLNARGRRKFVRTTDSRHGPPVCQNILSRQFHAAGGRREMGVGHRVSARHGPAGAPDGGLGMFGLRVIGRALSGDMEACHTTIPAMEMAFANRGVREGLTFHSDRRARHCAASFRERCPTVRQSMSRKRNRRDNACAETFFKTLERELETADGRHGEADVRQSVFICLEAYYNRIRLHSVLGYVAPDVFNSGEAA
jgi:transposase InsO family protein